MVAVADFAEHKGARRAARRCEACAFGYVEEENVDERRAFAGSFTVNAGDLTGDRRLGGPREQSLRTMAVVDGHELSSRDRRLVSRHPSGSRRSWCQRAGMARSTGCST